uniref:Venom allergen 3 n=1 Tax=Lygus hesperus TaxID=30085 RepID=A0A0A9XFB8_LYGHE
MHSKHIMTRKSCPNFYSSILLLWLTFSFTTTEDYCSKKCENGEYHTLCKFGGISPYCKDFHHFNDVQEKREILRFHNKVRNSFAGAKANTYHPPAANMMLMYWDVELEKSALRWAQQCTASLERDDCRDLLRFKVGQSVAVIKENVTAGLSPVRALLDEWYAQWASMELPLLDSYNSDGADVDELTQLLWSNTTRVGCADVIYSTHNDEVIRQLVCNYGPAGNILGRPVYLKGRPCSACPLGTSCVLKRLENLCAGEIIEQTLLHIKIEKMSSSEGTEQ